VLLLHLYFIVQFIFYYNTLGKLSSYYVAVHCLAKWGPKHDQDFYRLPKEENNICKVLFSLLLLACDVTPEELQAGG